MHITNVLNRYNPQDIIKIQMSHWYASKIPLLSPRFTLYPILNRTRNVFQMQEKKVLVCLGLKNSLRMKNAVKSLQSLHTWT